MDTIVDDLSNRLALRLRLERDSRGWSLADLAERVESSEIAPVPRSGRQELYENVVNEALWGGATPT